MRSVQLGRCYLSDDLDRCDPKITPGSARAPQLPGLGGLNVGSEYDAQAPRGVFTPPYLLGRVGIWEGGRSHYDSWGIASRRMMLRSGS